MELKVTSTNIPSEYRGAWFEWLGELPTPTYVPWTKWQERRYQAGRVARMLRHRASRPIHRLAEIVGGYECD